MKERTEEQKENCRRRFSEANKGKVVVKLKGTDEYHRIPLCEYDTEIYDHPMTGTKRSQEFKKRISITSSIEYRGIPHHNPVTGAIKHFHEDASPEGWIKGNGITNRHTKGTVFYHNPETKEQIRVPKGQEPNGWVRGRAVFKNSFTEKIVRQHLITRTTTIFDTDDSIPPLFVSHKAQYLYTYTDLTGTNRCTCSDTRIMNDLNLDQKYFKRAVYNDMVVITNKTSSNGLNKTHKGQHINDVYRIKVYQRSSLTQEMCDVIISQYQWSN